MVKVNYELLPIKAHYFFFMAAMGPILPQIGVFGKQLGVSPDVMGLITSVLPIMYLLAKPGVGFLIDSFPNMRKVIFMTIILAMVFSFGCFYVVPTAPEHHVPLQSSYRFPSTAPNCNANLSEINSLLCSKYRILKCTTNCSTEEFIGYIGTNGTVTIGEQLSNNSTEQPFCVVNHNHQNHLANSTCLTTCIIDQESNPTTCYYQSASFWLFVLLMCLGTIAFNVANCVSDATCFDMLGEKSMKYGSQRVWGTIGFGVTALLGGIAVNVYTTNPNDPAGTILPAIFIMLMFGSFDIVSIKWLKLPKFSSDDGESIGSKVWTLLQRKSIVIFLIFATLAGVLDSFVIYYMFWFLEEVAEQTGHMASIKLIEGCVVAAECLGGEILFFLISGKILKRIGYEHCLSFCFFMYAVRLGLISTITNPWWLVVIEGFMQGPTYALCYTCIVAYASAVAPPGTTATVQGLVAGMDDGLGFAVGSLIGGQMYKRIGGSMSFRVLAIGALITCVAHIILRPAAQRGSHSKINADRTEYHIPMQQSIK